MKIYKLLVSLCLTTFLWFVVYWKTGYQNSIFAVLSFFALCVFCYSKHMIWKYGLAIPLLILIGGIAAYNVNQEFMSAPIQKRWIPEGGYPCFCADACERYGGYEYYKTVFNDKHITIRSVFCVNGRIECEKDEPLQDTSQYCYPCDAPYTVDAKNCSEICPNRIKRGDSCELVECPSTHPLRASGGSCYSCESDEKLLLRNGYDCEKKCPNRILKKDDSPSNFMVDELFCMPRNL